MRKRELDSYYRQILRQLPKGIVARIAESGLETIPPEVLEEAQEKVRRRDLQSVHRRMWKAMQICLCTRTEELTPEQYTRHFRAFLSVAAIHALTSRQVLLLFGRRAPHAGEPSPVERICRLVEKVSELDESEEKESKKQRPRIRVTGSGAGPQPATHKEGRRWRKNMQCRESPTET